MRIVVLDGYTLNPGDNPWDELAVLGSLEVHDRSAPDRVVERAGDAEIILTNKTRLPAEILAALDRLQFVSVLATGYDVVDIAAARRRGIPVSNVPEYGTDSVAQHVLALLLELCHRTGEHDAAVHAGEWSSSPDFCFWHRSPVGLVGLTLGIVGYGRIGKRVAVLARCFGMHVVKASRAQGPEPADPSVDTLSLDELFAHADVISLHCPLSPDTARFVNARLLRSMKPTAFLINTARGALVDEADLADALNAGRLAGAAVDVVSSEPIRSDNPLLAARNCIITPHIAWAGLAARRRLMATTVENVRAFLAGRPINVVNGL
ncbi:MAG: D-2-hydroxyacid dehydrogenase [Deltaproteobacteria bacterium]|nr:D-2-hydroxyacid dehydrogenase [Deltaproteobacteria bacterium]